MCFGGAASVPESEIGDCGEEADRGGHNQRSQQIVRPASGDQCGFREFHPGKQLGELVVAGHRQLEGILLQPDCRHPGAVRKNDHFYAFSVLEETDFTMNNVSNYKGYPEIYLSVAKVDS